MESVDVQSFEDPALKVAVCRCCANECAPAALRERIRQSLAGEPVESTVASPTVPAPQFRRDRKPTMFLFGGSNLVGFAVAASFLVVVGITAMRLAHMSRDEMPQSLSLAMVTRHDICSTHLDHRDPTLPQNAFPLLSSVLQSQLGHAVLAADLRNDGWNFRGVSKCPVGDVRSAHFLFAKGDQTISVFSLPAKSFPGMDAGHHYETVVQNHPVVCFARNGAVFGFVGRGEKGDLKLADLESLVTKHESDTAVSALPVPPGLYAELIHDEP